MSFAPKQFIRSVDFLSTENAINTSTGCVNIYGGMSVSKDSYLTNMIVVGNTTINNLNITGALISSTGNSLVSSQWVNVGSNGIYFGTSSNTLVGIGTTTPGFTLDISGGSRITGALTVGNLNVNTGATITNILNTTICTGTVIITAGSLRATFNSNTVGNIFTTGGNVGINTSSPGSRLEVNGTMKTGDITVGNINFTGSLYQNGSAYLGSQWTTTSGNTLTYTSGSVNINSGFSSTFNSNTLGNIFTTGGNVGIGTSSPSYKLDVNGDLRATGRVSSNDFSRNFDNRTLAPNSIAAGTFSVGFGSYANNNFGNWADVIALNTYTDASGENQNAIFIRKNGIGMRIYQGAFGSASAFSDYRDVVLSNSSGNVGIDTKLQIGTASDSIYGISSSNALTIFGAAGVKPSYNASYNHFGTLYINSTSTYEINSGASIALGGRTYNFGGGNVHQTFARISGVQGSFDGWVGDCVFETNSGGALSERMRINASGNVGIGTNTPDHKLDVSGTSRITTSLTTGSLFSTNQTTTNIVSTNLSSGTIVGTTISTSNIHGSLGTISNMVHTNLSSSTLNATTVSSSIVSATTITGGNLSLSGNLNVAGTLTTVNITSTNLVNTNVSAGVVVSSTLLSATGNSNTIGSIFTTGGNVGIRTTSPNTFLVVGPNGGVNGTGDIPGISMRSVSGSTMSYSVGQSDTNNIFLAWYHNATPTNGYASLSTYSGSNNLVLQRDGGNVGIGTATPTYTLDINGIFRASASAAHALRDTITGTTLDIIVGARGGAAGSFGGWTTLDPNGGTTGNTGLYIYDGLWVNTGSSQFIVASTGNVGIGTTSPSSILSVVGGGSSGTIRIYPNSYAGEAAIAFYEGQTSGNNWVIGNNSWNTGQLVIGSSAANGPVTTFTTAGNVGIGTTSPIGKLSVDYSGISANQNVLSLHSSNTGTNDYNLIEAGHGASTTFVLKGNGNVGIGTTSPSEKLHINGNILLGPSTADSNLNYTISTPGQLAINANNASTQDNTFVALTLTAGVSSNQSNIIMCGSASDSFRHIAFSTMNTERMRLSSAGNIGIGTTSPSQKLELYTTSSANIENIVSSDSGTPGIFVTRRRANNGNLVSGDIMGDIGFAGAHGGFQGSQMASLRAIYVGNSTNRSAVLGFYTDSADSGLIERMRISGSNVGIGTTSPTSLLYINSASASYNRGNSLYIRTQQAGIVLDSTQATNGRTWNLWSTTSGDTPGAGSFAIFDSTASTYRILINTSGNVGIGLTAPTTRLDVSGDLRITSGGLLATGNSNTLGNLFTTSGNVGIGIATPTQTLEVYGNTYIRGVNNSGTFPSFGSRIGEGGLAITWNALPGTPGEVEFISMPGTGIGGGFNFAQYNSAGSVWSSTSGSLFRITGTGNIGISNANPSSRLHVVMSDSSFAASPSFWDSTYAVFGQPSSTGGAVALGYSSASGGCLLSLSPNVAWQPMTYRGSNHQFIISGTINTPPSMILNASGNLGIGATSPSRLLSLSGPSANIVSGPHIWINTSDSPVNPIFQQLNWTADNVSLNFDMYYDGAFRNSGSSTAWQMYKVNSQMKFMYQNGTAGTSNGQNNCLVLGSTGNVGINTVNPQTRLHVEDGSVFIGDISAGFSTTVPSSNAGPSTANGYRLFFDNSFNGTAGTGVAANKIVLHNNNFTCGFGIEQNGVTYHSGQLHRFYCDATTGYGSQAFSISSTQIVGYTNTNGEGLLKIGNSNAGSSAYGMLRVGNNAGDAVMFLNSNTRTADGGTNTFTIRNDIGALRLQGSGANNTIFLPGSSTNVGINTTAPSYTLQVAGDIYATGDVISFSDSRLKTDVSTITGALDKVSNMRGVYYTNLNTQTRETGVIAQEISEILPEVVADKGEYLGVAYGNIVGVLIEAIKELKARVVELESRVN